MKLDVVTLDAGKAGSIELSDEIFGIADIRGNKDHDQYCEEYKVRI